MGKLSLLNEGRVIVDLEDRLLELDPTTWVIPTIDYAHYEIHEQNAYDLVYSALKADTQTMEVRVGVSTSAKRPHMIVHVASALASTVEVWFNTTKTDVVGNRLTPLNRDQGSSNTSLLTFCHTPGGSQAGNANILQYIGSASAGGRTDVGGKSGGRNEWKLARGKAYLFKLTSRANGNALTFAFDWYEHTDKE